MPRLGTSIAIGASVLLLAACGGGDDDTPAKESLAPQFLPEASVGPGASTSSTVGGDASTAGTSAPVRSGGTSSTAAGGASGPGAAPTSIPADAGPATAGAPAMAEASITDAARDVTPSPLDRPPAWADLLGARLVRRADGMELRVRLGGSAAPQKTADAEHTMNIASFFDLNGDGRIDTEVWLNVAAGGWGATWFDNVGDGGGFQEGSGVTVVAEGDEVVARFPLTHLGGAERFRWAIASEWGRYETIGTAAAARDDLPDNDNVAAFPGA